LKLDIKKSIWIEDEGKSIGSNFIPDELFEKMRKCPVIKINIPKNERIKRIVKEYAGCDKSILIKDIEKITKRLGGQHAKAAIEAVENDQLEIASDILLAYYDKAYNHGLSKRDSKTIYQLDLETDNPKLNAKKILDFK